MSKNDVKFKSFGIIWAMFNVSTLNMLFFELTLFDEYFKEIEDYLIPLSILLVSFIVMNKASQLINTKILAFIIELAFIGLSVLWFLISYNLPIVFNWMGCDSCVCQIPGQELLIFLNFSLLIPLLNEWSLREQEYNCENKDSNKYFLIGIVLIAQGIISYIGYYWVPFTSFVINLVMIIIFSKFARNLILATKSQSPTNLIDDYRKRKLTIFANRWLKEMLFIAFLSIFGFSMLDHGVFLFQLFIPIGIGVIIFEVIYRVVKMNIKTDQIKLTMEGIIYGIVFLTICIIVELYLYEYDAVLESYQDPFEILTKMSSISTGIMLAYFWYRIDSIINRSDYPQIQRYKINYKCRIISKYGADILTIELLYSALFVIGLVKIKPEGIDMFYVYAGGLLVLTFLFLMWITDIYKNKRQK